MNPTNKKNHLKVLRSLQKCRKILQEVFNHSVHREENNCKFFKKKLEYIIIFK